MTPSHVDARLREIAEELRSRISPDTEAWANPALFAVAAAIESVLSRPPTPAGDDVSLRNRLIEIVCGNDCRLVGVAHGVVDSIIKELASSPPPASAPAQPTAEWEPTEEMVGDFRDALGAQAFPPTDEDLCRALKAVQPLIATDSRRAGLREAVTFAEAQRQASDWGEGKRFTEGYNAAIQDIVDEIERRILASVGES